MRAAFATLALAALTAASPAPAGVSSAIAPSSSSPAGCSPNYSGTFSIAAVNVSQSSESKRDLEERAGALAISLSNGVLTDSAGRTGYVASNSQFQFDKPPQAGAIFTSGFSVCSNGSLAIGNDAIWYQCLSGDFYNLYLHNDGAQCVQAYLVTSPLSGSGGPQSGSATPTVVNTASTAANATGTMTATAVTGAGNHTTIINSSGTPFNLPSNTTSTATAGSTSVIGGHTTVMGGHTTVMGGHTTVLAGGHHTTKGAGMASSTMGSGSGGSGSGGSSSSSASTGAAPSGHSRGEKFGLAAGLLAFAVL